MAQRRHHYESAFEAYLRAKRIPYIAVDEARKALLPDGARLELITPCDEELANRKGGAGRSTSSLKSFDFVVYGARRSVLLEIKGRKIPRRRSGSAGRGRLESWVTEGDLESLATWERLFGEGFEAAFVFVYWCDEQPPDGLFQEVFEHRGRWYALRCVALRDYMAVMKRRSARWRTVDVPAKLFERVSHPFRGVEADKGGSTRAEALHSHPRAVSLRT